VAVIIALVQVGSEAMPPGILLLTTSRGESWAVQFRLCAAAAPHRVVCLLDPGEHTLDAVTQMRFWNCYRTGSEDDWRHVVRELAKIVAIIVLDTRVDTPPMHFEVDALFDDNLVCKTYFLADRDAVETGGGNRCPILERVHQRARLTGSSGFVCDDESSLYRLVDYVKKVNIGLPSQSTPMSTFHEYCEDFWRRRGERLSKSRP
jgi:hypothetical protein